MTSRIPLPPHLSRGPFSVVEGRSAGLGQRRMLGPDLHRPFAGVRAHDVPRSVRELASAYGTVMHPRAAFSHATAAVLHDLRLPRRLETVGPLHVAVTSDDREPRGVGVVGHRVRHADAAGFRVVNGLRVLRPEVAWRQLARTLSPLELVIVGDALVRRQKPAMTLTQLGEFVRASGRLPGGRELNAAFGRIRPHTDSARETVLRCAILDAGLPEPIVNARIVDHVGRFLAWGDLVYPVEKILVEYDGIGHLISASQWQRDIERHEALVAAGWRIVRITAAHLRDGARRAVELVASALAERR